ncbi:MAG: hypothetical protein ACTSPF_02145, partial [Candidatus Heimdallarchaeaceae archaeon]
SFYPCNSFFELVAEKCIFSPHFNSKKNTDYILSSVVISGNYTGHVTDKFQISSSYFIKRKNIKNTAIITSLRN